MSYRITQKDLEAQVRRINEALGRPAAQHSKDETTGRYKSNIGNFHLSYAYGGVALEETVNEGGGVRRVSSGGYGTKKELFRWMDAYIAGLGDGGQK